VYPREFFTINFLSSWWKKPQKAKDGNNVTEPAIGTQRGGMSGTRQRTLPEERECSRGAKPVKRGEKKDGNY